MTRKGRPNPPHRSYRGSEWRAEKEFSFRIDGINFSEVPADSNGALKLGAWIKPEKVDRFVVGAATRFCNRRATLKVTGFWTEIKDS